MYNDDKQRVPKIAIPMCLKDTSPSQDQICVRQIALISNT